jgi:hypothetical protein
LFVFQDKKTGLYGYKDNQGNIKIEAKYRFCHEFRDGVAVVKFDIKDTNDYNNLLNSYGIVDTMGNIVASDYTHINDFGENGLTWALTTYLSIDDNQLRRDWVQINKQGVIKLGPIPNIVWIYNNPDYPICVIDMGFSSFYTFLDKNGNFLSDFNHDQRLNLMKNEEKAGELFSDVTFFSYGIAGIKGVVPSLHFDQLIVGSLLNDPSLFHYHYTVCIPDCRESVCYYKYGSAGH